MDYSTIAQPWQQPTGPSVVLPIRSNNTFFYKHNPRNWDFVAFPITKKATKKTTKAAAAADNTPAVAWRFVPTIDMERERAGVNGIRSAGKQADSTARQAQLQREGWQLLLPMNYDYLRVYPCAGGKYYDSKFNQLENIAGELVTTFDRQAFNQWKLELIKTQAIKLPHVNILRRYVVHKKRGYERYIRQQHIPELSARLESMRTEAELMQQEIDRIKKEGIKAYAF